MSVQDATVEEAQRQGEPGPRSKLAHRVELSLYRSLDAVENSWREFELRSDCTAFQAFDWLASWFLHVGSLSQVHPIIVVGKLDGDDLVFIFPLAITSGRIRYLTWLGSELCDYNAPLLSKEFPEFVGDRFQAVWDQTINLIREAGVAFDAIHLVKMPGVVGKQPNPFLQLETRPNPSGAYAAELSESWEEFYTAKRSSGRRKADRNRMRGLAKFGEVRLITPEAPDEITAVLEKLFQQKSRSLARKGAGDMFSNPGYQSFFRHLAASAVDPSFLHVSRLDVGNIWAATNVGLVFRRTYYHVVCSYERRAIATFAPGSAHLRELMRFAIDRGCERFDFTIGDEPYKLEWADKKFQLHDHISSASFRGLPAVAALEGLRRLKRTVKHSRYLWQTYLWIRTAVGARRSSRLPDAASRWSDRHPPT